ncbi:LysR family transcriptional regulator [Vibrio ostreicida]|uniref:LysR family transcriptional regulator n=1 Tax=Vibrio ostreicida TaxID=526588 RepID=A0ABT8C183_9VIBR|nr:LysR family transcriptional regulator [Vibrio ostreicida]MDN3612379.1 LysR family transcriptional regulator [Vibrio ostreicida]NPD09850.1 LysR family transcriptional regulator [Vibrio ostreicida]
MHDNISLFVSVVEAGNFKLASQHLNIPSSTIGRRIKALEDQFSCKLLSRNSHTFEVTREGKKLYEKARFHVNSIDSLVNELLDDVSSDRGPIKLLAPTNLVTSCIQEPLSRYLHDNPNIELELQLSNTMAHFYSSNADIAIRTGKQRDSDLTQLKLGTVNTVLVASPAYLNTVNKLTHPQDMRALSVIITEPLLIWELSLEADRTETTIFQPSQRRILLNDLNVAKQFSTHHLGIALLPLTEVKTELNTGQLVRVLPHWQGPVRDIYAIWYRRQLLSTRASKLVDFLKANLRF